MTPAERRRGAGAIAVILRLAIRSGKGMKLMPSPRWLTRDVAAPPRDGGRGRPVEVQPPRLAGLDGPAGGLEMETSAPRPARPHTPASSHGRAASSPARRGPRGNPAIHRRGLRRSTAAWTAGAVGVCFSERSGSAWIIAHWGWMPAREYTAFLQIGQVGLVEIGKCRYMSATRFSPLESQVSPRGRDARSEAPPPDEARIDQ
jgi:hypothetical protein